MPDGLAFVSVVVSFALLTLAGAKLGAGSHAALSGLFASEAARDWPIGVQEADAPHFVFTPPSDGAAVASPARENLGDAPAAEIEDLYAGPIR